MEEGDFLEIVTQTQRVVCHFYHRDFERCKLLDKHLQILARKYFDTRFIKLSAPVSSPVPCSTALLRLSCGQDDRLPCQGKLGCHQTLSLHVSACSVCNLSCQFHAVWDTTLMPRMSIRVCRLQLRLPAIRCIQVMNDMQTTPQLHDEGRAENHISAQKDPPLLTQLMCVSTPQSENSGPDNTGSVQDAPFFTVKLNIKVLPCVIMFSTGVAVDRVAGFDDFGAKDDFSTDSGIVKTCQALAVL